MTRTALVACSLLLTSLAGASPLRVPVFEENRGQAPPAAAWLARAASHRLLLGEDAATLVAPGAAVTLRLQGTTPGILRAGEVLPGVVNDLRGGDPSRWVLGAPTAASVVREGAWPGIDVVHHAAAGVLEHDFVVVPGADPSGIRVAVEGATACLREDGALVLASGAGEFVLQAPVAWEVAEAGRRKVAARYALDGGSFGFDLGPRDPSRLLVIDPVVTFATYLGGSGDEVMIAVDASADGDVAVAGSTTSTDYPVSGASQPALAGGSDAYVTRLDPVSGTVRWSTYFGGGDDDRIEAVAFDRFGNLYIAGSTLSTDLPMVSAADATFNGVSDGFIAKLSRAGALTWSTYAGGGDSDSVLGVDTDFGGDAYVVGMTASTDLATLNARQAANGGINDLMVGRISASGAWTWLTYHGGTGSDAPSGIAVSDTGVSVAGATDVADFPVANAAQATYAGAGDAFVAAFSPDGATLQFSTFLGGVGFDLANGVARGALGETYVAGFSDSPNFPVSGGVVDSSFSNGEAFVTRYGPTGTVAWSTFYGGTDLEFGNDVALDPAGNPVLFGAASSTDLTMVSPTQGTAGGAGDVFVAKIASDGASVLFSTYVGGPTSESVRAGAVDPGGFMTLAGAAYDTGFPTVAPLQGFASGPPGGIGGDGIVATIAPGTAGDLDGDAIAGPADNCAKLPNGAQDDRDADARGDLCDNCVLYVNASQADTDGDLRGDACEFEYGDVAPLGSPDGTVDIADAVIALRASVGLVVPTQAQLDALDVAPFTLVPGPPDVATPSLSLPRVVDIADAVAILRASVGLVTLTDPY